MDVLKTPGYPQNPRIPPFPQTSPRATDQAQAPEISPGPTESPHPRQIPLEEAPRGRPRRRRSRGAPRDLPWHAEGGGRIQHRERKRRKRRPGRERGPPGESPPRNVPERPGSAARWVRRHGAISGPMGPPQLPQLGTDELVACPERVKAGKDPKSCRGEDG